MSGKTLKQRMMKRVARRDGTACRYCRVELAHRDLEGTTEPAPPLTKPGGHCGCGEQPVCVVGCGACEWTIRPATGKVMAQLDHVIPRCRGGTNHVTNFVLACGPCNSSKGGSLLADWLKKRAGVSS